MVFFIIIDVTVEELTDVCTNRWNSLTYEQQRVYFIIQMFNENAKPNIIDDIYEYYFINIDLQYLLYQDLHIIFFV